MDLICTIIYCYRTPYGSRDGNQVDHICVGTYTWHMSDHIIVRIVLLPNHPYEGEGGRGGAMEFSNSFR